MYWTQLRNKNRKAFISSESLSKSLNSVLLLEESCVRYPGVTEQLGVSAICFKIYNNPFVGFPI